MTDQASGESEWGVSCGRLLVRSLGGWSGAGRGLLGSGWSGVAWELAWSSPGLLRESSIDGLVKIRDKQQRVFAGFLKKGLEVRGILFFFVFFLFS